VLQFPVCAVPWGQSLDSVEDIRAQDQVIIMAKRCEICGKGPAFGRNISHAHNVSPRRFEPNLQRVRALVNGGVRRLRVCTRCLRSGKVVKAA
jgi:large subunit ribosomal protein L28